MASKGRALIRWTLGIIIALAIIGYGTYQARNLIGGPDVTIERPVHGSVVTTSRVDIVGTARNVSHITLNDRPIFVDEAGAFSETVLLAPGYNVIELSIRDRFERTHVELLELVYQP
jgi:hypothetical protein